MNKLKSIAETVCMVFSVAGLLAVWSFFAFAVIAMYAAIPFAISYAIYRACQKYL